tara:strand:+ start:64 stop:759 length:696 start_codon:yes stop_codon:yes gene_type:complete
MNRTLIIFFLISISAISQNNPTDLKEYGFFGKIKKMTTTKFSAMFKDGEWKIDSNQIESKIIFEFNKVGNIERTVEFTYDENNHITKNVFDFNFKNDRKEHYIKSDSTRILERGKYDWLSPYKYELISVDNNGIKNESYSYLNNDFRDISGGTKRFENDSLTFEFKYVNTLDKNGEILFLNMDYITSGFNDKIAISDKEFDEQNNMTKFSLKSVESNQVYSFNVREIEYYE